MTAPSELRARPQTSRTMLIAVKPDEAERFSLRAGDILMNEGGDNDKLGATLIRGRPEELLKLLLGSPIESPI